MPGTFSCARCGQCCTGFLQRIRHSTPPDDYTVALVPLVTTGVTLLPWEVNPMLEGARRHQIQVKVVPCTGLLCKTQKSILVFEYFLYHEQCPFLSAANKCLIYQDRPLACRSFPIKSSGLLVDRFCEGTCPQFINPFGKTVLELNVDVEMTTFYQTYGEIYLSRLKTELIYDALCAFVTQLRQQGVLQLARSPEKSQRAQLRDYTWEDLFKFLQIPRNPLTIRKSDADCLPALGSDRNLWDIRPNPLSNIQKIYRMPFNQVRDLVTHIYIQRKMAQHFAPRGQRVVIMYKAEGAGHG